MNNVNPGILILAAACIILAAVLVNALRGKKNLPRYRTVQPPQPMEITPDPASLPELSLPPQSPDPVPFRAEPNLPPKDNSFSLMKDRLRAGKACRGDLNDLISAVSAEFGDRVTMDEMFEVAIAIGYPPKEVAPVMSTYAYQPSEIATLITEQKSLSIEELGAVIAPIVEGTAAEKVEEAFTVVKETLSADDDNDELLELPAKLGRSQAEAAAIIYRGTNFSLGEVIVKLELLGQPDVVAQIAKDLDQDLSDSGDYQSIRDAPDIEFSAAAAILKACGKDADDCISAENVYNNFSDDDESVGDIFSALSNAGFTNGEIMDGVSRADFINDNATGVTVKVAFERGIPVSEIIAFLKSAEVTPDTLDEELRELDVEILLRIDLLHAFLHADEDAAPPEEAALRNEE